MNKAQYRGSGYANLLRTSTDYQSISIGDQGLVCNAYARDLGMFHSFDKVAEGVSGSQTLDRWDLDDLVEAKLNGGDFDVVLVHDYSRLTRGGIEHAQDVKKRLAKVGLVVLSATEELPDGDEADLLESFYHYKNRIYSKNLSTTTTRAKKSALMNARHPTASTTPFGFDRLYITADGKPTLRIRTLSHGRKVKLDPVTFEVRGYIEPKEDGKCPKHAKQADEQSVLVPGEQPRIDLMNRIYKEYWIDGLSLTKITSYLNLDSSFKPFKADRWHEHTVHRMLMNPIYLGEPTACKMSKGWFTKIGVVDERPIPVKHNIAKLEDKNLKSVPQVKRPKNEWLVPQSHKHYAHPVLISDPEVWRVAKEGQDKFWQRWDANRSNEANRDRHKESRYFLKKLLHSKQGNYPMVGRTTSQQKERIHRYYRINESENFARRGDVLRKQIPADQLEKAVLGVIRETLSAHNRLGALIDEHVGQLSTTKSRQPQDRTALENEEKKLTRRRTLFYETAGEGNEDDVELKETIQKINMQLAEVRRKLAWAKRSGDRVVVDAAGIRDGVLSQIASIVDKLDCLSMQHLRRLVNLLCKNMSIDLITRQLDFEIGLPSWAMANAKSIEMAVGLESQRGLRLWYEADALPELKIAQIRCEHHRESHKGAICFRCQRIHKVVNDDSALVPAA